MTTSTNRRRRFARSRHPREFWITDRVRSILRALVRLRFLTIDQIIQLLNIEQRIYSRPPVSTQKVSRLLRDLYDAGYIERVLGPVTSLTDFDAIRRMPTTYALAQNGAREISDTDHIPLNHIDWRLKNNRVTSSHIGHTLGIADFVIAFLGACKDSGLDLIDHHDLVPYFPPAARDPSSLTLSVAVDGVEYTRRPDRLIALTDHTGIRVPFAHEWHSGEIPGRRDPHALWRGHRQTNFAETIWIYWNARNVDAFKAIWGASNFRILTVAESDDTIVNLLHLVVRITESPLTKLFLFTTPARLSTRGPLAPIWYAPQHAHDAVANRYTLKAMRDAIPISILDNAELSLMNAS